MVEKDINMLGENLKRLRMEKGLTVIKLKELSGVDDDTIRKLENGKIKDTGLQIAIKLKNVLDVTLDELYAVNENNEK